MAEFADKVAVVGGCGHVGLPLGIALADKGLRTVLVDINPTAVDTVNSGSLPFMEDGAEAVLKGAISKQLLRATTDADAISNAEVVVVVVGTPIDEHLTPDLAAVTSVVESMLPRLRAGQLLVLRSTVYPGVTGHVQRLISGTGMDIDLAFCPERIAEGRAMTELYQLPQIVAGTTERSSQRAAELFRHLTDQIVYLAAEEAELAKLFTNTWRYVKFATANQFFMIANERGLDFERIRAALAQDYPRAADLPRAGFAAGPCLFKDTMQLAAFHDNMFTLGHAAMMVNEGLPLYLGSRLEASFDLPKMTVGILGMAFKAESDDIRASLSYKLKKILSFKAKEVLTTDPYVLDQELVPLDEVLKRADLLVVATPHQVYKEIVTKTPIVDIWNLFGAGVRV